MIAVNLTVDVHCTRPAWALVSQNGIYKDSIYRIYVNGDLLTERTWAWDNNFIVREEIWIYCNQHELYTIKLEPILVNPAQATFLLDNLLVTHPHQQDTINQNTLSFTLA